MLPPNSVSNVAKVGYLAQAIQAIEANPFESRLTAKNPTTEYLKCTGLHSKNMPSSLRDDILNSPTSSKVLKYMDSSLETRALIRTSTAVDVIRGGEKGEFSGTFSSIYSFVQNAKTFASQRAARDGICPGQSQNRN
jgi:hypothetical protein